MTNNATPKCENVGTILLFFNALHFMNNYYFTDNLVTRIEDPNIKIHFDNVNNLTGGSSDYTTTFFVFSDTKNMNRLEIDLNALLHTYINDDKLYVFLIDSEKNKNTVTTSLLDARFYHSPSVYEGRVYTDLFAPAHWKDPRMTKEQLKPWIEKQLASIEKSKLNDSDSGYTAQRLYKVVTNSEENQFKVMHSFLKTPNGWKQCLESYSKDDCINYINNPNKHSVLKNEQDNYMIQLSVFEAPDGWGDWFNGTKQECLDYIKEMTMTDDEREKQREEQYRLAMKEEDEETRNAMNNY